jgi:hypothetical protein
MTLRMAGELVNILIVLIAKEAYIDMMLAVGVLSVGLL